MRISDWSSDVCSSDLHDPGYETLAHQASLAVAAVGVEAEADHGPAVAHDVRDHRDDRTGHLAEIDIGVGDVRRDRDGLLAYVDDAHAPTPDVGELDPEKAGTGSGRAPMIARRPLPRFYSRSPRTEHELRGKT